MKHLAANSDAVSLEIGSFFAVDGVTEIAGDLSETETQSARTPKQGTGLCVASLI